MSQNNLDPEFIANIIIEKMNKSGQWDKLGVKYGSEMEVQGKTEQAEKRCQNVLNSETIRNLLQHQPEKNEYELADIIEKNKGFHYYSQFLDQLLDKNEQDGQELYRIIQDEVRNYVDQIIYQMPH